MHTKLAFTLREIMCFLHHHHHQTQHQPPTTNNNTQHQQTDRPGEKVQVSQVNRILWLTNK
jgi:dipeptidase